MTAKRWQQVKEIVGRALETEPARREALVREACKGDSSMEMEVRLLLSQDALEIDECADAAVNRVHEPVDAQPVGRRVGAYELMREIGRGGMGSVWIARRADRQFEKIAAVKLLKRGTDTEEILRRFQTERQILARLEHPNIARLLDGGMTDDDLPFFVMEYVEGKPVTDYCRTDTSTVEEKLRLFLKICAAVQFAHQNLVVHRDLKPGNILVTKECEPKLLDFGIAKLLEEDAQSVTVSQHQRLTPAYTSPEQVRGEPVTTVSDVYTLGTLLYEMLSGQPAHRFSSPRPAQTQLLQVVVEQPPERPSAAAADASLKRQLRGDLDNIVLKAMRKAPQRRYSGVGAFAEDVRCYLECRPVKARKDTGTYRASKFIQRNKLGFGAAAVVILALVCGIVATTSEARRANRRATEVRRLANSMMLEMNDSIKDIPGNLAARQLVTKQALQYFNSLAKDSGNDLSLKAELATAYGKIGSVTFDTPQAILSHRKAAALNEELLRADPKNVSYGQQLSENYANLSDQMKIAGHSADAVEFARKSLAIIQALAKERPDNLEIEGAVADRYLALGIALSDAGSFKQAQQTNMEGLAVQQRVVSRDPSKREELLELADFFAAISSNYEDAGDYDKALEYNHRSIALVREVFAADAVSARSRRAMWAAFFRLGRQLGLTGDTKGALEAYNDAIGLIDGLATADPQDRGHQRWLAVTYLSLGELFAQLSQQEDALENYRKAISITERLIKEDPDRFEARRDLARMYESTGLALLQVNQSSSALEHLRKAESIAQAASDHDPQNARIQSRLAGITLELGELCEKLSKESPPSNKPADLDLPSAMTYYRRSLSIWERLRRRELLRPVDAAKAHTASTKTSSTAP